MNPIDSNAEWQRVIAAAAHSGDRATCESAEAVRLDPIRPAGGVVAVRSNRENFFLFTPMLHEIAASDLDLTNIVNPVRKMIRHVNFFCGDVDKIDIDKKRVTVSHGFDRHSHELEYDHLILALGR